MRRRHFLAAAAALPIAAPAVAQNTRAATLRMVPQANLSVLDPVFTTATVTGNHGFYIFDTLYGVDEQLKPKPQMRQVSPSEDTSCPSAICGFGFSCSSTP